MLSLGGEKGSAKDSKQIFVSLGQSIAVANCIISCGQDPK